MLPKAGKPPALTLMALLIVPALALTMPTLPEPDMNTAPVPERPPLTPKELPLAAEKTVAVLSCTGAWMVCVPASTVTLLVPLPLLMTIWPLPEAMML